jgi:hypothetical protein
MATATKNSKNTKSTKTSSTTKVASPKSAKNKAPAQLEVSSLPVENQSSDVMSFVSQSTEDVLLAFAEVEEAAIAAASLASLQVSEEVSEEVFVATEAEVSVPSASPVTLPENNEQYFVGTVHELSEKLAVEYVVAHGFARYLTGAGVAQIIGQRKVEGKRGRSASIYRIPRSASIVIPV